MKSIRPYKARQHRTLSSINKDGHPDFSGFELDDFVINDPSTLNITNKDELAVYYQELYEAFNKRAVEIGAIELPFEWICRNPVLIFVKH